MAILLSPIPSVSIKHFPCVSSSSETILSNCKSFKYLGTAETRCHKWAHLAQYVYRIFHNGLKCLALQMKTLRTMTNNNAFFSRQHSMVGFERLATIFHLPQFSFILSQMNFLSNEKVPSLLAHNPSLILSSSYTQDSV